MSIHQALHELTPNACWCMNGAQTYDNLQWNSDDIEKPSEEDVNVVDARVSFCAVAVVFFFLAASKTRCFCDSSKYNAIALSNLLSGPL